MSEVLAQFADAMRARDLWPPARIEADGNIHRCDAIGPHGKGDGSYLFHPDGVPAGGFQNWRDGLGWQTWRADVGRRLTPAEESAHRERVRADREKRKSEKALRQTEAAALAATIWRAASDATGHPYLRRKGVHAHGTKAIEAERLAELGGCVALSGRLLLVPVRRADGGLRSLQFIDGDGEKRFLTGAAKAGGYFAIGGKPDDSGDTLAIAEGLATAASVWDAMGWRVAVAFDAGNLRTVAETLRAKLPPSVRMVIAGDHDESGAGQKSACEAAQAVGGVVAIPVEIGCDWNDVHAARGLDAVRAEIETALAGPAAMPSSGGVEIVRADAITPKAVVWLWRYWLLRGMLNLIAGAPSAGKTTLALWFAATLSRGGLWPDGSIAPTGSTLMWSGEDDASSGLLPRFLANGGDPSRFFVVQGRVVDGKRQPFDPAFDMAELAEKARAIPDLQLIVLDPVLSAVAGDSHKAAEVRRGLQAVVDMAAMLDAAVLGVSHFGKNTSGKDTLERVIGSQAFGALARVVLAAAEAREDGEPRRLVRVKSNYGPTGGGFEYCLSQEPLHGRPDVIGQRVTFGAALEGKARELLTEIEGNDVEPSAPARDAAAEFLRDALASGPVAKANIEAKAATAGIKAKTLRNAASAIGIIKRKDGFRGQSVWSLPSNLPFSPKDALPKREGKLGTEGQVWATGTDSETF